MFWETPRRTHYVYRQAATVNQLKSTMVIKLNECKKIKTTGSACMGIGMALHLQTCTASKIPIVVLVRPAITPSDNNQKRMIIVIGIISCLYGPNDQNKGPCFSQKPSCTMQSMKRIGDSSQRPNKEISRLEIYCTHYSRQISDLDCLISLGSMEIYCRTTTLYSRQMSATIYSSK